MRKMTTFLAGAAIALGASMVAVPAYADGDDVDSNPITDFFASFGLAKKEKPDIDYRERAPLVPPTNTASLPPPVDGGPAARDAQWPNDPDVAKRARKKAEDDKLPTETDSYRMNKNARLMPSELGRKRTAGANVPTEPGVPTFDNTPTRLSPAQLRGHHTAAAAPAPTGVEPDRKKLSDPPTGYLTGNGTTAQAAPESKPWYAKLLGGSGDD